VFGRSQTLDMSIANKLFTSMSNLHFYHLSKGIVVGFSIIFDPDPIPDFANIYLDQATVAAYSKYLAKKP
jgi:hypothetical protein